jgi:hypothetical protein
VAARRTTAFTDPATSSLSVYGLNGREYTLTPGDAECLRSSAAVAAHVRDAVTANGERVGDSDLSAVLAPP